MHNYKYAGDNTSIQTLVTGFGITHFTLDSRPVALAESYRMSKHPSDNWDGLVDIASGAIRQSNNFYPVQFRTQSRMSVHYNGVTAVRGLAVPVRVQ